MRKVFRAIIYYKNHGGRQGLELVPLYKEDSAKFPQWVLYFGLRQSSVARVDYRRTESGAEIAVRIRVFYLDPVFEKARTRIRI